MVLSIMPAHAWSGASSRFITTTSFKASTSTQHLSLHVSSTHLSTFLACCRLKGESITSVALSTTSVLGKRSAPIQIENELSEAQTLVSSLSHSQSSSSTSTTSSSTSSSKRTKQSQLPLQAFDSAAHWRNVACVFAVNGLPHRLIEKDNFRNMLLTFRQFPLNEKIICRKTLSKHVATESQRCRSQVISLCSAVKIGSSSGAQRFTTNSKQMLQTPPIPQPSQIYSRVYSYSQTNNTHLIF